MGPVIESLTSAEHGSILGNELRSISRSRLTVVTLTVCLGASLSSACGGDEDDGKIPSGGSAGVSSTGDGGEPSPEAAGKASGGASGAGGASAGMGGKNNSAGSSGTSSSSSGSGSDGDCATKTAVASCSEDGTDPNVATSACVELYVPGIAELICGAREISDEGCPRTDQLRYVCVGGNNSDFWYSEDAKPEYWSNNEGGCKINGGSWCRL